MSRYDLPPLASVRVFEAAARHLSFTRAADELGMTQAAVSYQIRMLEDRVGAPLFIRRPRAVELTAIGDTLAVAASKVLDQLNSAFEAVRQRASGVLSINVIPTFAVQKLSPVLGRFQIAHPDLATRITATRALVDFASDDVDVAIRSGNGQWPGLRCHELFKARFTPMLSPALAERHGPLRQPADLLKLPLVDPHDPWWSAWFSAAGVDASEIMKRPISCMGDQFLEAQVALGGMGVAILTPEFYRRELETGQLIQPFPLVEEMGQSYWLCYAERRRNVPKIKAFRDWLLAEMAGTAEPVATTA
ncbi:transcriptional regulator GcvA [Notoacmeibacter marinus]|uniref:transcriptional regulator GcvA n=1 Tax=Notoacmeibacter marinus TaxID=1876515 RepID=UPI000DF1B23F|nr:transcriptional regulator GcvA [Notoacmeibacter marinus]